MKTYKTNISRYKLVKEPTDFPKMKLRDSKDAAEIIKQFWEEQEDIEIIESAYLLTLNRANNITGFVKISQGGTTGTVMDVKIIAKYAVESLSNACIVAHNHPSGNLKPSNNDIFITKEIQSGLKLLGITLLDHLIVTEGSYYSMADNNLIK